MPDREVHVHPHHEYRLDTMELTPGGDEYLDDRPREDEERDIEVQDGRRYRHRLSQRAHPQHEHRGEDIRRVDLADTDFRLMLERCRQRDRQLRERRAEREDQYSHRERGDPDTRADILPGQQSDVRPGDYAEHPEHRENDMQRDLFILTFIQLEFFIFVGGFPRGINDRDEIGDIEQYEDDAVQTTELAVAREDKYDHSREDHPRALTVLDVRMDLHRADEGAERGHESQGDEVRPDDVADRDVGLSLQVREERHGEFRQGRHDADAEDGDHYFPHAEEFSDRRKLAHRELRPAP